MAAQKSDRCVPVPSGLWCTWQALKGTNNRKLTIPDADLRGKWVLITGGNSGIGREAALQFSKWGANIVLGCRQPPPHEPHPDIVIQECKDVALAASHQDTTIEWWECDMGNLASVEAFGKRWLAKGLPLDILCNNAGMPGAQLSKVRLTIDGFEIVHQVNFLSHVLLTMVLLPSIRQAPKPRIICTTSCMQYLGKWDLANANKGELGYPNNKLYFQTWLTELQCRLLIYANYKHITVLGVHPGYVKTNIWHRQTESTSKSWPERVMEFFLKYVGIDAQQGSLAITNGATAKECGVEVRQLQAGKMGGKDGGMYMNRIWKEEPIPQTTNPECCWKIWEYVNKELKLEEKGLLKDFDA